jgi:poly(3-hydroxybutyrate) depolymerase
LRRGLLPLALFVAAVVVGYAIQQLISVDRRGASEETVTIDSRAVGQPLNTTVVVPADAPPEGDRSLLVFLHGRGGDEGSELDEAFFGALAGLGSRAPIVAFPSGDDSYWHDRADGDWGRYVVREVIPEVVERYGIDRRRVAIGGISMGGFGAYDIARLNPERFCAVAGHSPALWRTGGETAPGAFDDAEDFARHDVIAAARANPDAFGDGRLWLDAGEDDPFDPGVDALADALGIRARRWPGGHDDHYWNEHWPDYARFYARALARC